MTETTAKAKFYSQKSTIMHINWYENELICIIYANWKSPWNELSGDINYVTVT